MVIDVKPITHIYYRGSLRFCNYDCSYCPFSKNQGSGAQLHRDRLQFSRFVRKIGQMGSEGFCGTVQIVPYGEALVHEHYWRGMAELSSFPHIRAVGAQSNFSFPVGDMLARFRSWGGQTGKLRLWGTFHPEMTTVEAFVKQCGGLLEEGIAFCVGAVGVPRYTGQLTKLRSLLAPSVYMWINKMDGLGRAYTEQEIRTFLRLDPYFETELRHFGTNAEFCAGSVLVGGNGSVRPCIRCRGEMGNLYMDGLDGLKEKCCTAGVCDCFLTYGSRGDIAELADFQPDPAFRIPGGFRFT